MSNLAKVETPEHAELARVEEIGISIEQIIARVEKIRAVQKRVMREDVHYGVIPGTDKPALLKPGAELLCMTFQLDPQFSLDERHEGDHLEVVVTCTLHNAIMGTRLGSGVGSCSTRESRYAYRKGERVCPQCGKSSIIKGKAEYGGGWICFAKKGGCGAKYKDTDAAITGQQTGRVDNPDVPDLYNTVRKMACKRAHVAAVLFVTGGSELFTQDVDEGQDEGAKKSSPHSPHGEPEDYPEPEDTAVRDSIFARIATVRNGLDTCTTYQQALTLRELLGSKAGGSKRAQLCIDMQQARERNLVGFDDLKEIARRWNHCDRQLAKLEAALKTDAAEAFNDPPDADPADDFDR